MNWVGTLKRMLEDNARYFEMIGNKRYLYMNKEDFFELLKKFKVDDKYINVRHEFYYTHNGQSINILANVGVKKDTFYLTSVKLKYEQLR